VLYINWNAFYATRITPIEYTSSMRLKWNPLALRRPTNTMVLPSYVLYMYTIAVHSIASCSARLPTQEVSDRTVDGNLYYIRTHIHSDLWWRLQGLEWSRWGCIYKSRRGASIPYPYIMLLYVIIIIWFSEDCVIIPSIMRGMCILNYYLYDIIIYDDDGFFPCHYIIYYTVVLCLFFFFCRIYLLHALNGRKSKKCDI